MKILLSAIACNPYAGSENFFGWSAIKCLAREHDLWVVTSHRDRESIDRAQSEGLVPPNVRFAYDTGTDREWHPNRMIARIESWQEYIAFSKESLEIARKLHASENFDVVHHVTYTTWRVPSPMWRLGIPFVLGPIAGNEPFPFRLFPILSSAGAAFEFARKMSNTLSPFFPKVRESIRNADHVFVITEEAEQLMVRMRGSRDSITRLSAGFYSVAKAAEFTRFVKDKDPTGVLRLYVAGNLGGQKCISIAFQGLALAKKRGVAFRYHLGSGGPEIPHLKKLARELDLENEVVFGGTLSREEYQQELGRTHVYLLPSMRETVGLTGLEAMLAGCVPIVADTAGPRVTVTDECGYKIPVTNAGRMAEEIAKVVEQIDRDRQILVRKGPLASQRVLATHSEENYLRSISEVYRALTEKRRHK